MNENQDCFDCGGIGPCDVCQNEITSAEDIALELHRLRLLRPACCAQVRRVIERHLVANLKLAGADPDLIEKATSPKLPDEVLNRLRG